MYEIRRIFTDCRLYRHLQSTNRHIFFTKTNKKSIRKKIIVVRGKFQNRLDSG